MAETVPGLMCVILAYFLPESPRFLQGKGRHQEAMEVLEQIAMTNGKDPDIVRRIYHPTGETSLQDEDEALSILQVLQRVTVAAIFLFSGATIIAAIDFGTMQFGENAGLQSCGSCLSHLVYKYRLSAAAAGFVSLGVSVFLLQRCTRIVAIRLLTCLLVLSIIPFYWDLESWILIVAVFVVILIDAPFCLISTVYEGELIPTKYRSLGMGLATSVGYFGLTCGGFLALYVYHENRYVCFGVLNLVTLVAAAVAFSVSWKTKDIALKDA